MQCFVNGILLSEGNAKDMNWSFAEIIERASYGVELFTGDIIGSGTVGATAISARDFLVSLMKICSDGILPNNAILKKRIPEIKLNYLLYSLEALANKSGRS